MSIPTANSFRLSHEALLDTISRIYPLTRDYFQAKPLLAELDVRVTAYLGRQDKEFYENLNRFFAEDRAALKMLEFLELDLKDMRIQSLIFFEKHAGDLVNQSGRNFIKDFREFSSLVIARVKVEEDRLIPLLARINDAGAGQNSP